LMFALGSLFCSYFRPEFFLSWMLLWMLFVVVLYRHRKDIQWRPVLIQIIFFISINVLILCVLNVPISGGSQRFNMAFRQHFTLNWVKWNHSSTDSWRGSDKICEYNFGDSKTVGGAFIENTPVFLKHIGSNLLRFAAYLPAKFFIHSNIVLPQTSRRMNLLEGVLVILLFLIFLWGKSRVGIYSLKQMLRKEKLSIVLVSIIILPFVLTSIIIYPRAHYLLLVGIPILFLLLKIIYANEYIGQKASFSLILTIGLIILIVGMFITAPAWFLKTKNSEGAYRLRNLQIVKSLGSQKITREVRLLDASGGYYFYLPEKFKGAYYEINKPFFTNLRDYKINMIIFNDDLKNNELIKNDPGWKYFLTHYEYFGFIKTPLSGGGDFVLSAKELVCGATERQ
jgi:hypothetical protein